MIGTDPKANEKRGDPVPADLRRLVTCVKDKTFALLYRSKVPGTKELLPFSFPWRTITIEQVENVSNQVEFAASEGNFEIAVPLGVLGLKPTVGMAIKADVGVVRGDGMATTQRV
jgi:hypothetical protein